jgi:hypothetical protein
MGISLDRRKEVVQDRLVSAARVPSVERRVIRRIIVARTPGDAVPNSDIIVSGRKTPDGALLSAADVIGRGPEIIRSPWIQPGDRRV